MPPVNDKKSNSAETLQWVQLVVLCIGLIGFIIDIGKRSAVVDRLDMDLTELKEIVQDLVKAQIQVSSNDARHSVMIEDLKQRVILLESRK
jgi:uncharacterized protein YfcZ (UPF0381/DUF406 family)